MAEEGGSAAALTPVLLDDKSQTVDIEVMEVTSAATVEVSEHQDDTFEEQRMLQEEIKEEELEDAWSNNDPGGKRLLLKDWLIKKLDAQDMPDILSWVNKTEGLFRIKWLHKATDSWQMMADGVLFKEWCMYTGKYDPDHENPRKWKANFRCALNSLPDVIIVPSLCVRKGKDAYRVFKILPEKIPEKVREKQESSRKRRREKRLNLLKAYAKHTEEQGLMSPNIKLAITSEPSSFPRIKIPRNLTKKLKLSNDPASTKNGANGAVSLGKSTSSVNSATTTKSSGVLNGMDALCTAAAMMADKPPGEELDEEASTGSAAITSIAITGVSVPLSNDVVTYYRPLGPIQIVNKDGTPAVINGAAAQTSLLKTNLNPSTIPIPVISDAQSIPGLPIYQPIAPIRGVINPSTITSVAGQSGVVLNVKLANPTNVLPSKTVINHKVISQPTAIPQIPGLPPGICIQTVQPTVPTSLTIPNNIVKASTPTYLIPKNIMQRQVAVSAGNQPSAGKVIHVKAPAAPESIVSASELPAGAIIIPHSSKVGAQKISALPLASISRTCQVVEPIKPDMLEYYDLKARVAMMDYSGLRFQCCKHTQYIRVIRIYDSDKPCVEVSVSVYSNYSFSVIVHNRTLSGNHEIIRGFGKTIKTVESLTILLQRINEYMTCIGNPEEMPHQLYSDYSSFCSAYQEPDFGAKNQVLRYYSTIRSNSCQLLIKTPHNLASLSEIVAKERLRCEECTRIRTQVRSMRGLFCLLDGSKIPNDDNSRKRRLQLLKDLTTKEVLANRIDVLETQIQQIRPFLPTEIETVETVDMNSIGGGDVTLSTGFSETDVSPAVIESGGVIPVNVEPPSTELVTSVAGTTTTVYHVSNSTELLLVPSGQNTDRLLEELTNSSLAD